MKTSRIFINTFYYGVVPKLSVLANILVLPLITPYLTTYDYGISGVVFSYTDIILAVAPLGLNLYLTNSFYEMPKNYNLIWGRVYYLFFLSGLFFGIVNFLFLFFSLPINSNWTLLLISFIGSLPIVTFPSARIAGQLFPYLEKPKPFAFTNLITSLCGIGFSFVLIYIFKLGYWGLIANKAFNSCLSFVIFFVILSKTYKIKPIVERKWKRIKEMLLKGMPLVPHTLGFILLSSSARIIMNIYKIDYDDIGLFSHGYQMGTYVVIITSAMATALAPQMQTTFRKGDFQNFRKLYYLSQGVALCASFLVCIWMKEIYAVLINNNQLAESSSIAVLMCFAQALLPFYYFSAVSCYVDRKTSQLLWMVFVPSIANILLCLFLVPIFGYMAAVYSTMGSYWSLILVPFVIPYHKKWTKIWLGSKKKIIVIFFITVFCLIVGNFLTTSNLVVKILITLLVTSLCIYVYYSKLKPSLNKL